MNFKNLFLSSREDFEKDFQTLKNDPENNYWMKDYIKASLVTKSSLIEPNISLGPVDPQHHQQQNESHLNKISPINVPAIIDISSTSAGDLFSSSSGLFRNSARKHSELLNVYKGMNYDEWIEIRDKFLRAHQMKN